MRLKFYILCFLGFIYQSFVVEAQTTISLNPSKDNTLFEDAEGDISNGSGDDLYFGTTNSGSVRRALLKFDIAGNIPPGATITDVMFTVSVNRTTSGPSNASLHILTSDWGEGASNASTAGGGGGTAAETDDATWLNTFYPDDLWTNPGGDFLSQVTSTITISDNGNYSWTSSELVSDIQNWLDDPGSNFGWMIIGDETADQTTKRIASREAATTPSRPTLSITYTLPCIDPELPSLSLSVPEICTGQSITITATGDLHSATAWHVYIDGCGITPVGSESDGIIDLNPDSTTVYYVRGEGGCVNPGSCTEVTVTVNPFDDPTFQYGSEIYCHTEVNPVPEISGKPGGTFSVSPDGLIIDAISGEIDLQASNLENEYTVSYTTPGPLCPASSEVPFRIIDSYNESSTAVICSGDQYLFGTQILTDQGIYTEIFQSSTGCDSTVTLTLNVVSEFVNTISAAICDGDEYLFGAQTLTEPNMYTHTFQSSAGCDSTVNLTLIVLPKFNHTISTVICQGDDFLFGDLSLSDTGTYFHTFQSLSGCDSMVTLHLSVDPVYSDSLDYSICDGDSIGFGSQALTFAGNYSEAFQAASGCDSIVILTLTVNPVYTETLFTGICEGGNFIFGTQILTAPGIYTEIFESVSGCDSMVAVTLAVNPVTIDSADATICRGTNYIFGSRNLTTAGIYTETFLDRFGCDSTIILSLAVKHIDTTLILEGVTLISNESDASYQWIDCGNENLAVSGEINNNFTPEESGNYTVIITKDGCKDTASCRQVTIVGLSETGNPAEVILFPNPSDDEVSININQSGINILITIFDLNGNKQWEKLYYNQSLINLSLREFNPGIYFLSISKPGDIFYTKIIKN